MGKCLRHLAPGVSHNAQTNMHKLLIFHDHVSSIQKLFALFKQDYYCLSATSAGEALSLLEQHEVSVIIADQSVNTTDFLKATSEVAPFLVRIQLSARTAVEELVSAVNSGLLHAHIQTPVANEELRLNVHRAVVKYEANKRTKALVTLNARLQLRVRQSKLSFVRSLSSVLRIKDEPSHLRGVRVSQYADILAEDFHLNEDLREDLRAAALLHEIAFLTGSDSKADVNLRSAKALSCFPDLLDAADIVRFHRENFDGSGGPNRLRGEQIPIASRILRGAVEYDHLMQLPASCHENAIKVVQKQSGKMLDPRVVDSLSFVETKEREGARYVVRVADVETISLAVH